MSNKHSKEDSRDSGFRVIDRRSSKDDDVDAAKKADAEGPGFVMKESPEHPPKIDFLTLVFSFASTAMMHLGAAPDDQDTKKKNSPEINLELAQQNIDILGVLQEKTRGNLSADESRMLETLLTELRLRFVQAKAN